MGGCGSSVSSDNESSSNKKNKLVISHQVQNNRLSNSQNNQTPKTKSNNVKGNKDIISEFESFPEVQGNHYYGQGVRKVKAYKTNLAFDELEKLRKKFWDSKTRNRRIWLALKECCEAEHHETAEQLLLIAELACIGDNMMHIQEMSSGQDFYLPNWIISDPEAYFDVEEKAKLCNNNQIENLIIHLNDLNIKVTNRTTGKEIKNAYLNAKKLNSNTNIVRIFYRGKEILDDHLMSYHDVENNSNFMVMVRELE